MLVVNIDITLGMNMKHLASTQDTKANNFSYGTNADQDFRKSFIPFPKPTINACRAESHDAFNYLPRFRDIQQRLSKACAAAGADTSASALLLTQDSVGVNIAHSPGPVLIANIPPYLEPLLSKLAGFAPELMNWPTLDLRENHTVLMWSARDDDGQLHTVAVNADVLTMLPTPELIDGQRELSFARIVFCCNDSVAFTGFWVDESDIAEAQAAQMCGLEYWQYSDDEQAAANEKAALAGSPTPWLGAPWRDVDDGSTLTVLRLFVPS